MTSLVLDISDTGIEAVLDGQQLPDLSSWEDVEQLVDQHFPALMQGGEEGQEEGQEGDDQPGDQDAKDSSSIPTASQMWQNEAAARMHKRTTVMAMS